MTQLTWGFTGKPANREDVIACAPDGWNKIVDTLINDLFSAGWNGVVDQVKEKLGGLRFYIGESTNKLDALISKAEYESYRTCDVCGKPGELRGGKWLRTRCDEHAIL